MSELIIKNLSAGYGERSVLRGVNGAARGGEIIGLLGPNGSGKTTLMKTLLGLHKPSSGEVTLGAKSVHAMAAKVRAKSLAYLAQTRAAPWPMTARNIVALGRAPHQNIFGGFGRINPADARAIDAAIDACGAGDLAGRDITTLSGGEQARIFLARALAVGADVLLADEPVAALDPFYQLTIMEVLRAKAKAGGLVITALHDLSLASHYCDRVWVLDGGRLVADGPPEQALTDAVLSGVFNISRPLGGFIPPRIA
ncbi:MAG: ABC transporter ATP-binding protein [Robiginitomaculum sp.]